MPHCDDVERAGHLGRLEIAGNDLDPVRLSAALCGPIRELDPEHIPSGIACCSQETALPASHIEQSPWIQTPKLAQSDAIVRLMQQSDEETTAGRTSVEARSVERVQLITAGRIELPSQATRTTPRMRDRAKIGAISLP
jgi:hypothetical protein